MIIAIDAMGGDNAPDVNVIGARDALKLYPQISKIILVGDEQTLRVSCAQHQLTNSNRVEIRHASQVVEMHESGAKAIRRKKDSSVSVATELVKQGEAQAVVSAGNTGAAVAAATVKLRLLEGVDRAGIASPIPNEFGTCNILDAGANPEAKPKHLATYAVMGSVYANKVLKVDRPIVGIMSNGEEEEKGTALTKETLTLLKKMVTSGHANFDFRGNVEGHDLFETQLDVCLCDGFTGNVVLKSCEATAKAMSKWLKREFKRNPFRILGALLSKGAFGNVRERTNYETYGGSPLLGVRGIVIISHGSSSSLAIRNAIHMASKAIEFEVNPEIEASLKALSSVTTDSE